jgi:hypothetical protein
MILCSRLGRRKEERLRQEKKKKRKEKEKKKKRKRNRFFGVGLFSTRISLALAVRSSSTMYSSRRGWTVSLKSLTSSCQICLLTSIGQLCNGMNNE